MPPLVAMPERLWLKREQNRVPVRAEPEARRGLDEPPYAGIKTRQGAAAQWPDTPKSSNSNPLPWTACASGERLSIRIG